MVIVILGPMGCGKTTIGTLLAEKIGWKFADADDYHPEANKIKMGTGTPLDDSDREPWLHILKKLIYEHQIKEEGLVLACSALKEKYRDLLGIDNKNVHSVFLKGSLSLLEQRLKARSHEYMSNTLLQSQLDTLEEPQNGFVVNIDDTPRGSARKLLQNLYRKYWET